MDGELAGEEAPRQFSTRWRELGKAGMRDERGAMDSEGGVLYRVRAKGP